MGIYETIQALIGAFFIIIGVWSVFRAFFAWTFSTDVTLSQCAESAGETLVGVVLTLAGFFIIYW